MEEEKVEEVGEFQPTSLDSLFATQPSADAQSEEDSVHESKEETNKKPDEVKSVEAPSEPVENAEEPKGGQEPTQNWDDDSNPWKAKATEFEQRYKNTQTWGNRAHQKLKEYGLDDTPEPTEKDIATANAFQERERASYVAASQIHGKEYIDKMLYTEDAPLKAIIAQNPQVVNRILNADAPVLESIRIIKENEFFSKYGSDVDKIPDVIKKELEAGLRAEITKELQSKIVKKEKMPNTLSGVQSKEVKQDTQSFEPTPLNRLFGQ